MEDSSTPQGRARQLHALEGARIREERRRGDLKYQPGSTASTAADRADWWEGRLTAAEAQYAAAHEEFCDLDRAGRPSRSDSEAAAIELAARQRLALADECARLRRLRNAAEDEWASEVAEATEGW